MSIITELSQAGEALTRVYRNLTDADPFACPSVFLAESEKVIRYALRAGFRPVSVLMERRDLPRIGQLPLPQDLPVLCGSREEVRQLTGYTLDRGFLCAMERPETMTVDAVCRDAGRIALLENIPDPTDLGAVFRSAAALGIDGILIGPGCCDPLYRRCVRVSMGTVFQLPWTRINDPSDADALGYPRLCLSQSPSDPPLPDSPWQSCPKLLIHLGANSGECRYRIPLIPETEPLNSAAESAVAFWMLRKP